MIFAISILKIFFQKKFFAQNCLIRKDNRFFFDLPKFFSFSSWPPISNFLKFLKKLNFYHDHEELVIGNGTVIFSERSSFRKANNFLNLTQLKIIDFWSSTDLT